MTVTVQCVFYHLYNLMFCDTIDLSYGKHQVRALLIQGFQINHGCDPVSTVLWKWKKPKMMINVTYCS